MEQVRIVKEMRDRDERNGRTGVDVRPRYMVWENVPGSFSSAKGEDFRIVLEEIAKVAEKDAAIPMPDKGKWTNSGCILGDGWSIAWRVQDAQFWGVPQRRRRIALVADFGGQSAPEILFVRQSVSGDIEPGKSPRQGTTHDAQGSVGADDRGVKCLTPWDTQTRRVYDAQYTYPSLCSGENSGQNQQSVLIRKESDDGGNPSCNQGGIAIVESMPYTLKIRSGCEGGGKGALVQEDLSATLATNNDQYLFQPVYSVENHPNDSRVGINEDGMVQALTSRMGTGGGNVPMVMQQCFSKSKRAQSATDNETWVESETSNTLNAFDVGDVRTTEVVVYALDRASFNQGKNAQFDFEISDKGVNSPLVAKGPGAVCYGINGDKAGTLDSSYYKGCGMRSGVEREIVAVPAKTRYIVRRLTPLECERLQGYPDGWTDIGEWKDSKGKVHKTSDASRYKALGNSIALPPWKWVLKRICACYERDATMASLFDGIGGFPYLWEQLNGKGTCLWASEIEEFPMAVTKVRIGE